MRMMKGVVYPIHTKSGAKNGFCVTTKNIGMRFLTLFLPPLCRWRTSMQLQLLNSIQPIR